MNVKEVGSSAFQILECELNPGEIITVESGAMASQDVGLVPTTVMNGSFFQAVALKFFGGESFFINHFKNTSSKVQKIHISQTTPGDIQGRQLNGEEIFIETGSFIARTGDIKIKTKWAGFKNFIAGEGLFKLSFQGRGTVWYGCYGAVIEKEINGTYIVDSGHLLMWPPTIKLKLKLAGGLIDSFLSKEGFVLQLEGKGKIQLQTRSVKGLAQWLNTRFWR
jgi:uncharacterized protein (TIGR00266 family)